MQRTKIEWADFSWNPIKGLCPVRCWYCWTRKMHKRFHWNPEIRMTPFYPAKQLSSIKPSKIFVCSTFELFHPKVRKFWRDMIFHVIKNFPQHTFQILTKMPENIDRPMPDNVWLGVSVTKNEDYWRIVELLDVRKKAKVKFISFEPLLEKMGGMVLPFIRNLDWVIIGKLTGHGKKYNPKLEWILDIYNARMEKPQYFFLKNNLADTWGKPLIQEWPEEET